MAKILFSPGRMIGGSAYEPRVTLDNNKQPKIGKDGQPEKKFNIGIAIPKAGEQHWSQTEWGKVIWNEGATAYEALAQHPSFAWKITDGDSPIPDKNGKPQNSKVGYPGNWVVWFTQSWAPKLVNANGSHELTERDAIVPGYFVQMYAECVANGSKTKPAPTAGVYMNPIAIALLGYGERIIVSDVDTTTVGFGSGPMPKGMLATPPAESFNPAAQGAPYELPFVTAQTTYQPPDVPHFPSPAVPNFAFLQPVVATPPAPPAPHVPPVRKMTQAAQGWTYEQLVAAGWSDEKMVQAGMMTI